MGAVTALKPLKSERVFTSTNVLGNPSYTNARVLGAGTAEAIAVPTGAKFVRLFSSLANTYVNFAATAVTPAADVTDGSAAFGIGNSAPEVFVCEGVTNISVINAGTPIVTATFYS